LGRGGVGVLVPIQWGLAEVRGATGNPWAARGWGGGRRPGPARGAGGRCARLGKVVSGSSLPPSHVLDVEVETSAVDNVLMHAQTLAMHIQTNAPALPGRLSRLSER